MPVDPEHGWLPPGITGLSRQREWDAVTTVAAPECRRRGRLRRAGRRQADRGSRDAVDLEALAEALAGSLAPPFRASAVRHDDVWAVGGYAIDVVQLDPDPEGDDLELTWDGETLSLAADGSRSTSSAPRRSNASRPSASRGRIGARDTARRQPLRALGPAALAGAACRYPRRVAQNLGSFEKVLRVGEGRRIKRLAQQAAYIGTLEPEFEALSDDELRGKTAEFKQRIENGETLEEILFEAYAAVREAFKRTIGVRPFDVQLMAGVVLHEGDIAEQKTGEGKTFTAVQALYLNALSGRNVHLVTVNDYLAKRDSEWTRPVYEALGASVGAIQNLMPFDQRRVAYGCDVTYGTNSEFGFDYLRDNMAVTLEGTVQKGHTYAIVDEVDSILIDEARTPLIISGEPETAAKTYYDFARVVRQLEGEPYLPPSKIERRAEPDVDYTFDEKFKTVSPLPRGIEKVERAIGIDNLYNPHNVQLVNHLSQALKAQALYHRDKEYVIARRRGEDRGRVHGSHDGRQALVGGIHQAVEAKETVDIREEQVTIATITIQNYFRLDPKLAGMTGTAETEEKSSSRYMGSK